MKRISRRTPTDTSTDPVTGWAEQVVGGKVIACNYVVLACKRHLQDLEKGPKRGLRWSEASAKYAIDFFPFLRHSKGEFGNKAFHLSPWQQFVVGSVWGWKREDGTRRFRVIWEEIPRKNGKSTKLAGIGLLALVADNEPGAEVYAAATKKDQARIIFDEAKRMVATSPEFSKQVRRYKTNLSIDKTGSKFEPLSSDEKTLDGLNPHCVLIDEIHKHKSRAVLDVLDTAMGSRRQPLLWQITTAGDDNPESVYSQEHAYAVKILEGVVQDDNFFAFITTIDKDDAWDDPKAWAKANPNLGVSVKLDDLKRQLTKAKQSPSAQSAFKRLRLNVRGVSTERYIPGSLWAANTGPRFDPDRLKGRPCYGAIDLSSKIDITCWLKLFPPVGNETTWKIATNFWIPADTVGEKTERDLVQYQRWIDEGWMEPTAGDVIDHGEVRETILKDLKDYQILNVAYDPWNATQLVIELRERGVPAIEFVQGLRSYTAPTKELMNWLLQRKLDHGMNPVLTWMASNLAVQKDKNENLMPTKKHSVGRIDGMTSLIMAIGIYTTSILKSPYETRGVRTV